MVEQTYVFSSNMAYSRPHIKKHSLPILTKSAIPLKLDLARKGFEDVD
jgi:hypothetical protein